MAHLFIDSEKCMGCGMCASVCIRKVIKIENWKAVEHERLMGCFDCGHCAAICPSGSIKLTAFPDDSLRSVKCGNRAPVKYDALLSMLAQRRSMRWMTGEPVSAKDIAKLMEAAKWSPSANNANDSCYVVIGKDFKAFEKHLADTIGPYADRYLRWKQYVEYQQNPDRYEFNPFFWKGKQVILAFSKEPADSCAAMARVELAAETLGLGGFYSVWLLKADRECHSKFMEFFPEIPRDYTMNAAFVIGHPSVRFMRTVPRPEPKVFMR